MNNKIVFLIALLFTFSGPIQAQQIIPTPEEKALQAATDMHKRLGLKDGQLEQVYHLNLVNIQKTRRVKTEKASNYKKLDRHYQAILEEYNLRLRSVLTPEQYQRWELLREEARERRKIIQTNLLADNRITITEALIDPETEFEHLVTQ